MPLMKSLCRESFIEKRHGPLTVGENERDFDLLVNKGAKIRKHSGNSPMPARI